LRNADELPNEAVDNFHKQIGINVKKQRELKGYTQYKIAFILECDISELIEK